MIQMAVPHAAAAAPWWEETINSSVSIVAVIALAWLAHFIGTRMIRRAVTKWVDRGKQNDEKTPLAPAQTVELQQMILSQRREQRAVAIGQLLRNMLLILIWGSVALMILAEIGADIGPLMASAGVVGVALGFGAQTLVKDYLSGFFMIIEDQYGVGDLVDLGSVVGTVEEVTLRVTRLRDLNGVVWYVRNGEILRVANQSQGWTLAVAVMPVAYDADLDLVRHLVTEVGNEMFNDPDTQPKMLGRPQFGGVDAVSGEAVYIRVACKARPTTQVSLTRELRERLKVTFDRNGIKVPVLARPQAYGPDGVPLPPGAQPPGSPR